ncbi:MAG: hypothetical protein AAF593_15095, partial [Planctomycetota bacterium]
MSKTSFNDPPEATASRQHATRITAVKRNDEAEAKQRPLDWRLIARLWRYADRHAFKRNALVVVVLIRAVQLPLVAWWAATVINGPVF